jgi:carboxylesterase
MFRFQTGTGDKTPISTIGDGRGVLCLHGMTGTPFEVRPIGEALGGNGYSVEVPLLAGHGGSLRDLATTQWPDWLASAERAMDQLRRNVGDRPIAIVGFSMGGLLALRLARTYPDRRRFSTRPGSLSHRPVAVRRTRCPARPPW